MRYLPVLLLVATTPSLIAASRSYDTHDYWVLESNPTAPISKEELASTLGAEFVEQVGELERHYLVKKLKDPAAPDDAVLQNLHVLQRRAAQPEVANRLWNRELHHARQVVNSIRSLTRQVPRERVKRWMQVEPDPLAPRSPGERLDEISNSLSIHDPGFSKQWHLLNEKTPPHDMNVTGVWKMGYTGKGVVSAIVDDGLDMTSEDLAANYWAEGSYDFNDHVPSPVPRLSDDLHGTRCAGEIAAVRNDVCGVGVAYDSKVSGIRILSGAISDADEAAALNYGFNRTDIYSCSWGPPDDGRSMEAPSSLIVKAVLNGIENGRNGKGSIFVFASGNGAGSGDQCNFDGYTNSIYSVTVSAVDSKGEHPYYSEPCAANMVVAYSSGGGRNIHTTDVGKRKCSSNHGGTSAAAPLAVGVIALALEARPELTWRDVQHLCVQTATQLNPEDPDWDKTHHGRPYSYKYGFGALDAYKFVTAAKTFPLVKPQAWIEMPQIEFKNATMSWSGEMEGGEPIPKGGMNSTMEITEALLKEKNFETLEHVTVKVWINHKKRGDVEVSLLSPNGVKSVLGGKRRYDEDKSGYPGWTFMTLKHWEENPVGKWTILVNDQGDPEKNGAFLGWTMSLWGSTIDASKASKYSLRPHTPEDGLPNVTETDPASLPSSSASTASSTSTSIMASTTKQYTKPTDHLPTDHDIADGDSKTPTFPDHHNSTSSMIPTPDEGYFSHMSDLLANQTWLFGGVGIVVLFAIGVGVYFWRRRVIRRKGEYSTVADDELALTSMLHGGRAVDGSSRRRRGAGTKELYDAFGEVSDDGREEDEDEMALAGERSPMAGLRYHDGFLDDDGGDSNAATSPAVRYRDDEPSAAARRAVVDDGLPEREEREASSPSGSGSGSWEHTHVSSTEALNRLPP
ncbi:pheromone processing endoprotease [Tulasnella sp. JGI-2019a]|nr:pheromone processing endoprotease [Tulasnella sp. JGI-2019a]KAG9032527.1 pheromone processing endoprotease [Tulasnella sp. JGI-2019a]